MGEAQNRRKMVQAVLDKKMAPYLQNNQSKKGWRHGSNGRVTSSQDQRPEFKSQNGQNK
jgi:hypothetical protein